MLCRNLSNFLLSLCPYVFVLMHHRFESHLSLLSLTSFSPSQYLLFFGFFLSRTQHSHLSALLHPVFPSYSHVRTDVHSHTHPPLSPPDGCTCVPGFGPDTARVAAVESGKCSSCPICRPKQVQLQTTCRWTRAKTATHTRMKLVEKAHTASRMPLLFFKSLASLHNLNFLFEFLNLIGY